MAKKAVSLICLFAILILLTPVTPRAAEQTVTKLTAAISKNGSYIELKCSISEYDLQRLGEKKLVLFSVSPYTDVPQVADVIAENVTPAPEMTLQAPYNGDITRVYRLAVDNGDGTQSFFANRAFIGNPDALASDGAEFFVPNTKKGLNFTMFADAQYLGAGNTVIQVALNEFITENTDGLMCRSGSKYCYIDRSKLDSLDNKIKTYTDAGIRVFLQFVLDPYRDGKDYLYKKQGLSGVQYYAFNIKEEKAADSLYAFTAFLMDRYAVKSDNGFCASIILGYEVNSNRKTNYAGPMSLYGYTENYALTLRTVDLAARSVYKDARVYVSLGNELNKTALGENADPALDYSVTEFLTQLSSCISEEGDFPWRVEIHPRNIDSDPIFVGKQGSEYSYEADYLTMDNYNVITSLLSRPAFLYNGQRRTVVINEISFNSAPNSDEAQAKQAAAFCLAYFRAEANDQTEAFIYRDQTDSATEASCYGLYTKMNGTNGKPDARKQIYKVFRYIDTDSSRIIAEPYLSVLSVSSWGEIVSGYNGGSQMKTRILTGSGTASDEGMQNIKPERITDFSSGTGGFYPSESAKVISSGKDEDGRTLYGGENSVFAELSAADPHEYRGISANFEGGADLAECEYALIDVKVKAPENVKTTDILIRLSGVGEDGTVTVYEGTAQISSDAYHRIYFDISAFSSAVKKADRVSVWVRPHGEKENGEYGLTLNGISVFHKSNLKNSGDILLPALIIAGAVVLLLAAAYVVIFIKTRKQYKRRAKLKDSDGDPV